MPDLSRRHLIALGAGGLSAALLAACDGSASAESEQGTSDRGGETTTAGGTLRLGAVAAGAAAVDPHGSLFSEADWFRMSCLYDQLLIQDGDELVGRLATEWTADEDATTWTFTLRDDAVFSDGSPVRAADVLHSMQRMHDLAAENGMRLGTVDVSACDAVSPTELKIVTSAPDAELPAALAGNVFVVPEGVDSFDEPVGSGPFRQQSVEGSAAVLTRNPDWWGGTEGAETVEIHGFSDPQAMAQALTTGALDAGSSLAPTAARTVEEQGNEMTVHFREGAECYPLLLRVDATPFDKPEVREAIKLGLDREALVQTVFLGYGVVGADMIKHGEPGVPSGRSVQRDVAKAKELLAEADIAEGAALVLHTTQAYPGMVPTATLAAEQLAEIGLNVQVKEHDPQAYWSEAYTVEPFCVGYWGDTSFATTVRQTTLTTSAFSETGWSDEQFDADFAEAMSTADETERHERIGRLHERMADEGGWVVWGFGHGIDVTADGVDGLRARRGRYCLDGVTGR